MSQRLDRNKHGQLWGTLRSVATRTIGGLLTGELQPHHPSSGWSFWAQSMYLQKGTVKEHMNVVLLLSLPVVAGLKDSVKVL